MKQKQKQKQKRMGMEMEGKDEREENGIYDRKRATIERRNGWK